MWHKNLASLENHLAPILSRKYVDNIFILLPISSTKPCFAPLILLLKIKVQIKTQETILAPASTNFLSPIFS